MKLFLTIFPFILITSCVGYNIGNEKPKSLQGIEKIAVPMFENRTQEPRAEALATAAVSAAIMRDSTYQLVNTAGADAILEGILTSIQYSTLRSSRLDSLLAEELTNKVTIEWTLRDAKSPLKVLASGRSNGQSTFFVDSNLQTARRSALPDAFERASSHIIASLSIEP